MRATLVLVALCLLWGSAVGQSTPGKPQPGVNNVWYSYNQSDTVLILVHGITSDSASAWQFEGNKAYPALYWPSLLATPQFGNPSVFLGGFYTEALSGTYTIRDAAEELFTHLTVSRSPATEPALSKKNIVFLAHSLGGIVVRHMLVRKRDAFAGKKIGLVLLASPSLGSKDADRLSFLADLASNEMGKQLRWKDPGLEELDRDFRNLVDMERNLSLVGLELLEGRFYKKTLFLVRRAVVVDEESGGRYFGAPIRVGDSDHSSIIRPTHDGHRTHVEVLKFFETKFRPLVGPTCRDFLVAGRQYSVDYVTTTGPHEIGRQQRRNIAATTTVAEAGCRRVTGTFAEDWSITLVGCDTLDLLASRPGEGDLRGHATCTASEAKGSFGYVDKVGQSWGYTFRISPR